MTENYKVVANLPYQITSAVIRKFLESDNPPSEMVLMVQKEVAERICAKPGDMSLLAVSVQYYANPEIIMQVPRSYFWPEPKVDSAVIRLSLRRLSLRGTKQSRLACLNMNCERDCFVPRNDRQTPRNDRRDCPDASSGYNFVPRNDRQTPRNDSDNFFKIVKAGFASKRKMLLNNLIALLGKDKKTNILNIFKKIGLSEKVRAEELGVGEWKRLTIEIIEIER